MQQKPRPAGQFAIDRLRRIMLPYWPIGIALALAYTFLPSLSDSDRTWGWLPTLTLLPTVLPPALSVAWTLQHELVFYLLYAALFFSGWVGTGLAIWGAAIGVGYLWGLPDWPLLRVVLATINIEFIAGVVAASLFLSGRAVPAIWSFALSASFLLAFVLAGGQRNESWFVGFAISALLPWLCRAERTGRFNVPRWLVFGGAASYAIYLTHNPLLSLTTRILALVGAGWVIALILSAVICATVGAGYYLCWERPIMRLFKRGSGRTLIAATR